LDMNESLVILVTRFRKEVHCTSVQKVVKVRPRG